MFYEFLDKSSEKTVVFLHGWGGNHESLFSLMPVFDEYNVLTLDFWGFGNSEPVSENYDIYSYSDAVVALLKYLKLDKLTLVGHSFGGRIAIIISSEIREKVENLILIDSAGILPKKSVKKFYKKLLFKFNNYLVKHGIKDEKTLIKYYSADYLKLNKTEQQVFKRIINEDLEKYLDFITQRALIIWGEKDKDTPLYMAKKMERGIKNSELVIIKNASHFAYIEHTNLVNKVIKDFLK